MTRAKIGAFTVEPIGEEHNVSFTSKRGRRITLRIASNADVVAVWGTRSNVASSTIERARDAVRAYAAERGVSC